MENVKESIKLSTGNKNTTERKTKEKQFEMKPVSTLNFIHECEFASYLIGLV